MEACNNSLWNEDLTDKAKIMARKREEKEEANKYKEWPRRQIDPTKESKSLDSD